MSFDPEAHQVAPARWFDDLALGEIFRLPSRTLGDGNFTAFQTVSLDNHPIHYDVAYCARRGLRGPLEHGLQVLSLTAAGAGLFPHQIGDALLGFIEVNAKFLKGVFPGDTLYAESEVLDKRESNSRPEQGIVTVRTIGKNQHGDVVCTFERTMLIWKRGFGPVDD